ncbi:MAG: NAD(P)/FAD-dependent oxidoreductase, partial [Ardenticatenaceae bacterium]
MLLFPRLVAYALAGGLIGLLYGMLYERLMVRLEGSDPIAKVPPSITKRVVVLGGGYAGVSAAQELERQLVDDPSAGIWLVSQTNYLIHTPMLSEVSASSVNPQNISPPLRSFFNSVQVVQGAVERVDLQERVIHLVADARSQYREIPFDHLVLTLGSVPNFFGNESIAAAAFTFKSLEDAILLRNQIIDMFERADFEPDEAKRRRMLTFVVAGGGFAGVELIGGINDFARGILAFYPNVPPEEVRLVLVHSRDRILPELSEELGKYAQQKLEQRGVEFKLGVRVTGARPDAVLLGDEILPTETFVWTAGNRPSPVLATLDLPLSKGGQLEAGANFAVAGVPGLWAAGDCAQVPDLSTGKFVPPTAQHAIRAGKVLGYN